MKEIFQAIKRDKNQTYNVYTFDLGTARAKAELNIVGTYILVSKVSGYAEITLNEPVNDSIDLRFGREIESPFYRFFLTNAAQTGSFLTLIIGYDKPDFNINDFSPLALIGSQVLGRNVANNATVVLYTVPVNKSCIFDFFGLSIYGTVGNGTFDIYDGSTSYPLVFQTIAAQANISLGGNPNLVLPYGWSIRIISSAATISVNAFAKGREF